MAYVVRGGKPLLIDLAGTVVKQLDFDLDEVYVYNFSEGLARVNFAKSKDFPLKEFPGNLGFMDTRGEVVIRPQFTYAEQFRDGLALVGTEEGRGYVNRLGEMIWQTTRWN